MRRFAAALCLLTLTAAPAFAGDQPKPADEAADYAKSVVLADLEENGEEDLFRKVRQDLDKAGVAQSDHQIRANMAELLDEARAQIKDGR